MTILYYQNIYMVWNKSKKREKRERGSSLVGKNLLGMGGIPLPSPHVILSHCNTVTLLFSNDCTILLK